MQVSCKECHFVAFKIKNLEFFDRFILFLFFSVCSQILEGAKQKEATQDTHESYFKH